MQLIKPDKATPASIDAVVVSHNLANPDQPVSVVQKPEDVAESWVHSLMVREQGQRLKRNPLAQVVHDAVVVEPKVVIEPVADFQASDEPVKSSPRRSRFKSWLRQLSPRNRDIADVVALAHDMGRDYDEATARRFLDFMRGQERERRREQISRLLRRLKPNPHL